MTWLDELYAEMQDETEAATNATLRKLLEQYKREHGGKVEPPPVPGPPSPEPPPQP